MAPWNQASPPNAAPSKSAVPPNAAPSKSAVPPNAAPSKSAVPPNAAPWNQASPPNAAPSKPARPPNAAPRKSAVLPNAAPSKPARPAERSALEVGVPAERRALEVGGPAERRALEVGGPAERRALEVGGPAERRAHEGGVPAERRAQEVGGAPQRDFIGGCLVWVPPPGKWQIAKYRLAEIRIAEIEPGEVDVVVGCLSEIRAGKIGGHVRTIDLTPSVPGVLALPGDFQMFFVGHGRLNRRLSTGKATPKPSGVPFDPRAPALSQPVSLPVAIQQTSVNQRFARACRTARTTWWKACERPALSLTRRVRLGAPNTGRGFQPARSDRARNRPRPRERPAATRATAAWSM